MDKISIVLAIIGVMVLIFSFWSFQLIRKHVKRFNNNHKFSNSLNDEKYFELKARQDYIIASSAIVFAVLSFIGYSSIKDIKNEMNEQMAAETKKLQKLNNSANETLTNFEGIEIKGKNLQDSVRSAMSLVSLLKSRVGQIFEKDVIKQNIFIVDPLRIGDFPNDTKVNNEDYRIVKFKSLSTISGQKLPVFKIPPSIICFSTNDATLFVTDVTTEGFKINVGTYRYLSSDKPEKIAGENVRFSLWISQKQQGDFNKDDFDSKDFN